MHIFLCSWCFFRASTINCVTNSYWKNHRTNEKKKEWKKFIGWVIKHKVRAFSHVVAAALKLTFFPFFLCFVPKYDGDDAGGPSPSPPPPHPDWINKLNCIVSLVSFAAKRYVIALKIMNFQWKRTNATQEKYIVTRPYCICWDASLRLSGDGERWLRSISLFYTTIGWR